MSITKPTVDLLRAAWTQGVQEILDRELEITKNALVVADTPTTVAMLQGRAKAYQAMLKFPDYISNFLETEAT